MNEEKKLDHYDIFLDNLFQKNNDFWEELGDHLEYCERELEQKQNEIIRCYRKLWEKALIYTPKDRETIKRLALSAKVHEIESLCFWWSRIGNRAIAYLKSLPNLKYLDLSWTKIDDNALAELIHFPNLIELNLCGTKITDDGMAQIARIKSLKSLNIGWTNVGDSGLSCIGKMVNLQILDLRYTGVTNLQALENLLELQALNLRNTAIDDFALRYIASSFNLRYLNIGNRPSPLLSLIRHDQKIHYVPAEQVTALYGPLAKIEQTKITSQAGQYLGQLQSLKGLDVSYTDFGNEGVAFLSQLYNLEMLNLEETIIGDFVARHLTRIPSLKFLNLKDTSVSDEALEKLAQLPLLARLNLHGTRVTKQGKQAFCRMFLGNY